MECGYVNRDGKTPTQKMQEITFCPTIAVKETEDQKVPA